MWIVILRLFVGLFRVFGVFFGGGCVYEFWLCVLGRKCGGWWGGVFFGFMECVSVVICGGYVFGFLLVF